MNITILLPLQAAVRKGRMHSPLRTAQPGILELILAKARHGDTGNGRSAV